MSREIKFRVWQPWSKNFRYIKSNYDLKFWSSDGSDGPEKTLLNLNWMQFIGLKDKNGKEIYEGDYVKFPNLSPTHETSEFRIAEVFWYDDEAGYFVGSQSKMIRPTEISALIDDISVIGNIYENPELLNNGIK